MKMKDYRKASLRLIEQLQESLMSEQREDEKIQRKIQREDEKIPIGSSPADPIFSFIIMTFN